MKETLAIIAAIMAFVGNISYIKDVFKERVHPHPYTWFIWSIVSLVTFFGQWQKGAGIGVLPTAVAEVFTIIIFLYSLKHLFGEKVWHIRTIDHYFLAAALLGLIPWYFTKDPTISVLVVVMIDVIAFIPTLEKTWYHPQTERPLLYQMNVTRHILTLFSLEAYNIATTVHSVAMIITNTLMAVFIKKVVGNGKEKV
ncbi:MAG: hypothetical protein WAW92_02455 [Minisyncoccia bacterium]